MRLGGTHRRRHAACMHFTRVCAAVHTTHPPHTEKLSPAPAIRIQLNAERRLPERATARCPLARPPAGRVQTTQSQLSFPTPWYNTTHGPVVETHPFGPAQKSEDLDAVPMHPTAPDDAQPLRREYHPRNAQTAVVTMTSATIIATASPESVLPPMVSCSSRPILRTVDRR